MKQRSMPLKVNPITCLKMKSFKIIIFTAVLIFCLAFFQSDNAFAGTQVNVTVYVASGIVVGGAAFFISIMVGERHSSKKEKTPDDKDNSKVAHALNWQSAEVSENDISQAGLVKILEW